jgi:hypothetical protein
VAEDERAALLGREALAPDAQSSAAPRAVADSLALRRDAETLASDPVDLEETRRVRHETDERAADWPED